MAYENLMDDAQEKKKFIGNGELEGLVRDPGREVWKPTEML
jgi:hypothetical protein